MSVLRLASVADLPPDTLQLAVGLAACIRTVAGEAVLKVRIVLLVPMRRDRDGGAARWLWSHRSAWARS